MGGSWRRLQYWSYLKLLQNFNALGAFVHLHYWDLDGALHDGIENAQKLK